MRIPKLNFRTLVVLSFFILSIMIPAANAGHNWNIVQIHKQSADAGISVYLAFSYAYQSFILLEQGEVAQANTLWEKKVLKNLKNARSIYEKSVPGLPDKYRDLVKNIPPASQPMVLKDLGRYGIYFPASVRDLASVAESELRGLEELFDQVRFEKNQVKNRELIRKINDRMTRFIDLGISFSTISMWNKE